jgi:hypothetical protein
LKLVEAEPGRVTFTGVAREEFYNGMGVAHGSRRRCSTRRWAARSTR